MRSNESLRRFIEIDISRGFGRVTPARQGSGQKLNALTIAGNSRRAVSEKIRRDDSQCVILVGVTAAILSGNNLNGIVSGLKNRPCLIAIAPPRRDSPLGIPPLAKRTCP